LWFDGSGWCVLAKRLEAGSFQIPPLPRDATQVQIDGVALSLSTLFDAERLEAGRDG